MIVMTQSKGIKVVCPHCGYKMPLIFKSNSNSNGVFLMCKGRSCKKTFELIIKDGIQIGV